MTVHHHESESEKRKRRTQLPILGAQSVPSGIPPSREQSGTVWANECWRSFDELADTEEFREMLHREFPHDAAHWLDPVSRRHFLQLMGASLALAGLTGCTVQPTENIVPYVKPPEGIVPGKSLFYATAMPLSGAAVGLLVESHEGRPTKIEGNPDHPASLGATDAFAQASILTLYDPDRSRTVTYLGDISTWPAFLAEARSALETQRASQGAGLRVLTETVTSPTLADQLRGLLAQFPAAKWHQYEPVNRDQALAGARLAFGVPAGPIYRFENADVVLAIESDFLSCGPASLRYAREFAGRRRGATNGNGTMNRLYAVESTPTNTGAAADHRWPLRPDEIEGFARAIAAGIGVQAEGAVAASNNTDANRVMALVRDLERHRGRSIVTAGDEQPPVIHALVAAINQALGNVGQTVFYIDPVEADPADQTQSLRDLVAEMEAGRVEMLLIIGGNPVYTAPADMKFGERMAKVRLRAHLSLYNDETSELCHWHIPETHYLEAWGDARAYDGTASIIQPLIMPLYQGRSAHELLAAFSDRPDRTGYEIVRDYWRTNYGKASNTQAREGTTVSPTPASTPAATSSNVAATGSSAPAASASPAPDSFEQFWRKALHDGFIPNTAFQPKTVTVKSDWSAQSATQSSGTQPANNKLAIIFRADPTIHDGRFANNGWLQELPKPLTKLTWDNAALVSPATARRLGLDYEVSSRGGEHGEIFADVAGLNYQGRSLRAPVRVVPGHADDCVTVHLGYGRWRAGRAGNGAGFNAYQLRTTDAPWIGHGVEIRPAGERHPLACTQLHYNVEGRDIVRSATSEEFRRNPHFAHERIHAPDGHESLYPEYEYKGYAWGMAIDLGACVGCNACVVACQSENNIPVVGRDQVRRGREMHWLRIDRYYKGYAGSPETFFQPVPCMHCEKAPCEVVCPVNATVHDSEGLNVMVYNRCVGTRYCSNNCPYKVRRFNFLLFQDWETPSLKLARNPDVSVRSRGVMEKCTYCVQRIQRAKIESEKENRRVRDGEVVTACQAACPTEAIVFGDINDRNSRVARLKAGPRNYGLLEELQTQPRTTYLAAVRNPNPEIEQPQQAMK